MSTTKISHIILRNIALLVLLCSFNISYATKIKYGKNVLFEGSVEKGNKCKYPSSESTGILKIQNPQTDSLETSIEGTWETISYNQYKESSTKITNMDFSGIISLKNKTTISGSGNISIIENKNETEIQIEIHPETILVKRLCLKSSYSYFNNIEICPTAPKSTLNLNYNVKKEYFQVTHKLSDNNMLVKNVHINIPEYAYDGSLSGNINENWIDSTETILSYEKFTNGELDYKNGKVFNGSFLSNKPKEGKLKYSNNDWENGTFSEQDGTLTKGVMDRHLENGHFVGTVDYNAIKGDLYRSKQEYCKNAIWAHTPLEEIQCTNIKEGNLYYEKDSLFLDCYIEDYKYRDGTVKGQINTSMYKGYVNGTFEDFYFVDGEINASLDKGPSTKIFNGVVKDGLFNGKYQLIGEGLYDFDGNIENGYLSGIFTHKSNEFQFVDVSLGNINKRITEVYGSDTLTTNWDRRSDSLIIKSGNFKIHSKVGLFEGNLYTNGETCYAEIKRNGKLEESLIINNTSVQTGSILGLLKNRIEEIELKSLNKKTGWENFELKGKVKEYNQFVTEVDKYGNRHKTPLLKIKFDTIGNVLEECVFDKKNGDMTIHNKYKYDKEGRLIENIISNDQAKEYITTYDYDKNGRLVKSIRRHPQEGLSFTEYYTYDTKGQLIETRENDIYGDCLEKVIYSHDKKGCVTEESHTVYYKFHHKYVTTYNEHGDTLTHAEIDKDGMTVKKTYYKYDSKRKLIERREPYFEKSWDLHGGNAKAIEKGDQDKYTYKYDSKGKLIEVTHKNNLYGTSKIRYNEEGDIIEEIGKWSTYKFGYLYDERGNTLVKTRYLFDNLKERMTSTYDKKGNTIQSLVYLLDNNKQTLSLISDYEYEYHK